MSAISALTANACREITQGREDTENTEGDNHSSFSFVSMHLGEETEWPLGGWEAQSDEVSSYGDSSHISYQASGQEATPVAQYHSIMA